MMISMKKLLRLEIWKLKNRPILQKLYNLKIRSLINYLISIKIKNIIKILKIKQQKYQNLIKITMKQQLIKEKASKYMKIWKYMKVK